MPNRELLKDPLAPEAQVGTSTQDSSVEVNRASHEAPGRAGESEISKDTSPGPPTTSPNSVESASPVQRVSHPPEMNNENGARSGEARETAENRKTFARPTESDESRTQVDSVEVISTSPTRSSSLQRASNRPPLILDATITVLLVLVAALLCRKLL